jgi:hypothetical protein
MAVRQVRSTFVMKMFMTHDKMPFDMKLISGTISCPSLVNNLDTLIAEMLRNILTSAKNDSFKI